MNKLDLAEVNKLVESDPTSIINKINELVETTNQIIRHLNPEVENES